MNKSIKKSICIFLSVLLLIVSLPATTFAEQSGDYTYSLDSDGNAEITGFNSDISGDVVIPEKLDGHPVTSIGGDAFRDCSSITSITIPDSVTVIGKFAFYSCISLTNITIPDSVTQIGNYAFYGCISLTNITIPDSVTEIGWDAFYGCTSLISITIPDSVTAIGLEAFYGCTSLTNITIPDSVTSIGDEAFSGCTELTNITIPDSVTVIGMDAFSGCTELTNITIPDSVTKIGGAAFKDCTSLTSIDVDENNGDYCSQDGILFNKEKTKIESYPAGKAASSYDIPESVTGINMCAFSGCTSLTSVTIPDRITLIEYMAFSDCTLLTGIIIPDSITVIKDSVFSGCTSLESITIPDSVTKIGYSAFEDCTSLESITIPDSVKEIGMDVFYNTKYYNNDANWSDGVIYIGKHLIKCKEDFSGAYDVKAGTKCIASEAFRDCTSLTKISIPDSITSIDWGTFEDCTSLKSITIPDSVTLIGWTAFDSCDNLSDVYYGGSEEQWNTIDIDDGNEDLTSATIHFNSSQHEHTYGEWTVTTPATFFEAGIETRTCSSCGNTETRDIPKLETTTETKNEDSGISVLYTNDSFDGEVKVEVAEIFDGQSYQIINQEKGNFKYELFDISITKDGAKVQPNGSVVIKLPVPEGYNTDKLAVYYVTNEGKLEKMKSYYADNYMYFEAKHFSEYVLVDESEPAPSETTEPPTTPPTVLLGDVNGDGKIKANDARIILRTAAGLDTLTEEQIKLADMNGDGKIKANDARVVLRIAAGLE